MNVYIVFHEDSPDGSSYIRGVYATRELADVAATMDEAGLYRRTHSEWCCGVSEWEAADALPYVMHGPEKPYDGPMERIVPDAIWDIVMEQAAQPNLYRKLVQS